MRSAGDRRTCAVQRPTHLLNALQVVHEESKVGEVRSREDVDAIFAILELHDGTIAAVTHGAIIRDR
jgi:hypothetical protein